MKVYIAGKIAGDPVYFGKFLAAECRIEAALKAACPDALLDFEVNCRAKPVVLNPARLPPVWRRPIICGSALP